MSQDVTMFYRMPKTVVDDDMVFHRMSDKDRRLLWLADVVLWLDWPMIFTRQRPLMELFNSLWRECFVLLQNNVT